MTIDEFEKAFCDLETKTRELLAEIPEQHLYLRSEERTLSPGENLLRSAAAVEQMAGGITTRLWDDPFEWTLPEKLRSKALINAYLDEVEESRRRAFAFLQSDEDLNRRTPAPLQLKTIREILTDTLSSARAHLSHAGDSMLPS